MPSTDMQNSLNALDTRDITLPRRLWSWLVTQAKKNNESVDEVVAHLIEMHRHPEVAPPDLNASNTSAEDKTQTEQSTPEADVQDKKTDSSRPQGAPPPSANPAPQPTNAEDTQGGGPDTYSAADRLRKASDRLQRLMREEEKSDQDRSSASRYDAGTQIQELLKNNDKLKTLEPPEPTSRKNPDEGVSMFDMAAGADNENDESDPQA
ncbi:MAG: hypothetical protein R6U20_02770 [Longimonas sp.]